MAKLAEKSAFDTVQLPARIGTVHIRECTFDQLAWVHLGRASATEFKDAVGVKFPPPNRMAGRAGACAIWFAPNQALWTGPPPAQTGAFTMVDQKDAWATLTIEGQDARDVLSMLTPLDVRSTKFKTGHTARTLLGHMGCSICAVGANKFDLLVFRSMAGTALHELTRAMKQVAALRR